MKANLLPLMTLAALLAAPSAHAVEATCQITSTYKKVSATIDSRGKLSVELDSPEETDDSIISQCVSAAQIGLEGFSGSKFKGLYLQSQIEIALSEKQSVQGTLKKAVAAESGDSKDERRTCTVSSVFELPDYNKIHITLREIMDLSDSEAAAEDCALKVKAGVAAPGIMNVKRVSNSVDYKDEIQSMSLTSKSQ